MKMAGLIVGILLMLLSGLVFIVSLIGPMLTSSMSRSESMVGIIPSVIVFVVALLITIVFAILLLKSKKSGT